MNLNNLMAYYICVLFVFGLICGITSCFNIKKGKKPLSWQTLSYLIDSLVVAGLFPILLPRLGFALTSGILLLLGGITALIITKFMGKNKEITVEDYDVEDPEELIENSKNKFPQNFNTNDHEHHSHDFSSQEGIDRFLASREEKQKDTKEKDKDPLSNFVEPSVDQYPQEKVEEVNRIIEEMFFGTPTDQEKPLNEIDQFQMENSMDKEENQGPDTIDLFMQNQNEEKEENQESDSLDLFMQNEDKEENKQQDTMDLFMENQDEDKKEENKQQDNLELFSETEPKQESSLDLFGLKSSENIIEENKDQENTKEKEEQDTENNQDEDENLDQMDKFIKYYEAQETQEEKDEFTFGYKQEDDNELSMLFPKEVEELEDQDRIIQKPEQKDVTELFANKEEPQQIHEDSKLDGQDDIDELINKLNNPQETVENTINNIPIDLDENKKLEDQEDVDELISKISANQSPEETKEDEIDNLIKQTKENMNMLETDISEQLINELENNTIEPQIEKLANSIDIESIDTDDVEELEREIKGEPPLEKETQPSLLNTNDKIEFDPNKEFSLDKNDINHSIEEEINKIEKSMQNLDPNFNAQDHDVYKIDQIDKANQDSKVVSLYTKEEIKTDQIQDQDEAEQEAQKQAVGNEVTQFPFNKNSKVLNLDKNPEENKPVFQIMDNEETPPAGLDTDELQKLLAEVEKDQQIEPEKEEIPPAGLDSDELQKILAEVEKDQQIEPEKQETPPAGLDSEELRKLLTEVEQDQEITQTTEQDLPEIVTDPIALEHNIVEENPSEIGEMTNQDETSSEISEIDQEQETSSEISQTAQEKEIDQEQENTDEITKTPQADLNLNSISEIPEIDETPVEIEGIEPIDEKASENSEESPIDETPVEIQGIDQEEDHPKEPSTEEEPVKEEAKFTEDGKLIIDKVEAVEKPKEKPQEEGKGLLMKDVQKELSKLIEDLEEVSDDDVVKKNNEIHKVEKDLNKILANIEENKSVLDSSKTTVTNEEKMELFGMLKNLGTIDEEITKLIKPESRISRIAKTAINRSHEKEDINFDYKKVEKVLSKEEIAKRNKDKEARKAQKKQQEVDEEKLKRIRERKKEKRDRKKQKIKQFVEQAKEREQLVKEKEEQERAAREKAKELEKELTRKIQEEKKLKQKLEETDKKQQMLEETQSMMQKLLDEKTKSEEELLKKLEEKKAKIQSLMNMQPVLPLKEEPNENDLKVQREKLDIERKQILESLREKSKRIVEDQERLKELNDIKDKSRIEINKLRKETYKKGYVLKTVFAKPMLKEGLKDKQEQNYTQAYEKLRKVAIYSQDQELSMLAYLSIKEMLQETDSQIILETAKEIVTQGMHKGREKFISLVQSDITRIM